MTSLLLHVIDEEMRVDDPHGWKTLRLVQREQRRATEPAIYPQNEITNSISHTQTSSPPSTNIIQSTSHLSFKNLNPEVICMILSYLFGDCIENTAKASKTVRDALMTKYTMHEQLNQMWSVKTGGNAMFGTEASHPLDILEVFLRNPRVAPNLEMYPRLLQLEGCDEREHCDNPLLGQQISEHTRRLAKLLSRDITTAVEASPRLSSQEQHEWSHQICSYRQGPALALLVSLLLGIQSLVLFDSMSVVQDLDPCSSRIAGAYERLSYVETGSTYSGYYENFTGLAQFMVLQSLRSFRGLRLSDTKFTSLLTKRKFHREEKLRRVDKLVSWPTDLNTCQTRSTITKLKLDSCALRTGSLHRILSSIQCLEEFSYTCNWPEGTKAFKYSEWGGRGHWEPPKIAKILLETAMTTLVSLDLTNIGEYCAQRGADYSVGSLRDFYKLKYVRVEYMMFVQDAPHDRWSTRVRSLLSVMPESLQYLSLAGPIFPADDASAVLDFLARRKKWKVVGEDGEREEDLATDEDEDGEHAEGEESRKKKKKKKEKKHGDQRSKKKGGKKGMSLQNLAKKSHGRGKKVNSRETMDSKKEKGKKGKAKKKEKKARRKQRELEEGEEQKRKRLEKEETDALMMEQRGFIPVLTSWQLGVPHLKEIIFEDFYGEGTLRDLLRPFRKGAEKHKIRLCEARLATRPPLRVDDRAGVDDGDVADEDNIRYEHEPMLVNVVNNLGGHSYHAWAEVWKSSDPSMPTALVTELFPSSHPIVSSAPSHVASSTIPPDVYPSLSSVPKVLLRAPPEESTYPPDATRPATAPVVDLRRPTGSSADMTDADSDVTDTDSRSPVSSMSHLDVPRPLLARSHKWKKTAEGYPASPAPSDRLSIARSRAAAARSKTHSSSMQLGVPMAKSSLTPGPNTPLSMQMERITDSSRPSTSSTLPPFPPPPPLDAEDDFKNPVEEYIPPEDKCDGMLSDDEVSDFDDDDDDSAEEDGDEEDPESSAEQ